MNDEEFYKKIQRCYQLAELLTDVAQTKELQPIEMPVGVEAPHSELCMHVGCAGRPVIGAYVSKNKRYGIITYIDRDGECQYTDGLLTEILPEAFVRIHIQK